MTGKIWAELGLGLVLALLPARPAWADGTVQYMNTALSKILWETIPGGPVVDAPPGTQVQLHVGTNSGRLTRVGTPVTISTPGLFCGNVVYPVPGTRPGQRIFVKIEALYTDTGGVDYLGESEVVETLPLGPELGPGTVFWQPQVGTHPNRMRAFTVVLAPPLKQTIAFPALPDLRFGDPPFALAAVASSGLPVVYHSSDLTVATVSGDRVTIVGAGTTIITASQRGDLVYRAAPEVSQILTVRPGAAVVQLAQMRTTYQGLAQQPVVATIPPGLPVGLTFNGRPDPPVNAGVYDVVATVLSPNYVGSAAGVFTIERAGQVIAFPAPRRAILLGDPVALRASASSRLPVTLESSDPAVARLEGDLAAPVGLGQTVITASQPGDQNYLAATNVSRVLYVECGLEREPSEFGTIVAEPDLISYPAGTTVVLTAAPLPGYGFLRWEGALSGNENPASLVMNTNHRVSAVFVSVVLDITVEGEGTVVKEPDLPFYQVGQQVLLRPQPGRWHLFAGWGDGRRDDPRVVTVGESNSYRARFVLEAPLETLTIGGVSRVAPVGTPAILVNGVFAVDSNVVVRSSAEIVMVTSYPGGRIVFTADGSDPDLTSGVYDGPFLLSRTAVLRARAYSASFLVRALAEPLTVKVLPNIAAETTGGGRVEIDPPAGDYRSDGTVRVTAIPSSGWQFLYWQGDAAGTNPVASVRMNRPRCVHAVFGVGLADSVFGLGEVQRIPSAGLYPYGATVRFVARPAPGYFFALWAGSGTGTNNPLSFLVTSPDKEVKAVYAPLPAGFHALTVVPDGFGRVEQRPRGNRFLAGTSVTLTAIPVDGQAFVGWDGDGVGALNPLTVSLAQSRTITARFTKRPRVSVVNCQGAAVGDALQVLVTGEYGERYGIERRIGLGVSAWVERAVIETPYGTAQFRETVAPDSAPRVYRAVRK